MNKPPLQFDELPSSLAACLRCDCSPERRAWLDRLPMQIRACERRWSLSLGEPYEPGGQCSWVVPARTSTNEAVVLKLAYRHEESEDEADGLRAVGGRGAVRLYDGVNLDELTSALLLERCPGPTLSDALPESAQDVVIAKLLPRLWEAPTDVVAFRPLATMCQRWAVEFQAGLAAAPSAIDDGLAHAALQLWDELSRPAAEDVLLSTDLHAGNILRACREPWLMIDPKPYVGDRTYDVLQHLVSCQERLIADPACMVDRTAGLLDLDVDRLAQWLFARCAVGSLNDPALLAVARALAP